MTRMILVVTGAIAGVIVGLQPAQAYEAPWCAAIEVAKGSVYWDCQYRSFEDCYNRSNILAGNRGFCNPSPYYVAGPAEQRQSRTRRARAQ